MIGRLLALIFLLSIGISAAFGATQAEIDQVVNALSKPLPEDLIFYRWQSKNISTELLRAGKLNNGLIQYFADADGAVAGPGMYIAGNPFSSSDYVGSAEGMLVEVHVKKGTPTLDVSTYEGKRALEKLHLTEEDIYQSKRVPALVKYENIADWWVVKGNHDVTFHPFNSKRFSVYELNNIYLKMKDANSEAAFREMTRAYVLEKAKSDSSLVPLRLVEDVLPAELAVPRIQAKIAAKNASSLDTEPLLKQVFANPETYPALDKASKVALVDVVAKESKADTLRLLFDGLSKYEKSDSEFLQIIRGLLQRHELVENSSYVVVHALNRQLFRTLSDIRPEHQGQYADILDSLEHLGLKAQREDVGALALVVREKIRHALFNDDAKLGISIEKWFMQKSKSALAFYDTLPSVDRDRLYTPKVRAQAEAMVLSSDRDLSERALRSVRMWGKESSNPALYINREFISKALSSAEAVPRENMLNWILTLSQDHAYKTDALVDWGLVEKAIAKSSNSELRAVRFGIAYPGVFKIKPEVDLVQVWSKMTEKEGTEFLYSNLKLHKNPGASPQLIERWRGLLEYVAATSEMHDRHIAEGILRSLDKVVAPEIKVTPDCSKSWFSRIAGRLSLKQGGGK